MITTSKLRTCHTAFTRFPKWQFLSKIITSSHFPISFLHLNKHCAPMISYRVYLLGTASTIVITFKDFLTFPFPLTALIIMFQILLKSGFQKTVVLSSFSYIGYYLLWKLALLLHHFQNSLENKIYLPGKSI